MNTAVLPLAGAPASTTPAANDSALEIPPPLGRPHARRLREVYRSAGWPCQDLLEIELLATGMLQRVEIGRAHV